jgi:hypothetical protein
MVILLAALIIVLMLYAIGVFFVHLSIYYVSKHLQLQLVRKNREAPEKIKKIFQSDRFAFLIAHGQYNGHPIMIYPDTSHKGTAYIALKVDDRLIHCAPYILSPFNAKIKLDKYLANTAKTLEIAKDTTTVLLGFASIAAILLMFFLLFIR